MLLFFLALNALVIASLIVVPTRALEATVLVIPPSLTVPNVGINFSVNVTVENVENLYGYQFNLTYPNDILNGTSVVQGPFLKPGTFEVVDFTDNFNATDGIVFVFGLSSNSQGVNGSGTLATITFKSTAANGPRILHLSDVELSSPTLGNLSIPFTQEDGQITVLPEFPFALTLPLLVASTLFVVILRKRAVHSRRKFQSV